jgi:hypothetical protein
MVRRDEAERARERRSVSGCTFPAGASPASVSSGAPSSRPQTSQETAMVRAGCRKPLWREQARGPQHQVKPAASTDLPPESRAAHVTAKAMFCALQSGAVGAWGLGGVGGAARVQGGVWNTRGPSARPELGQTGSYKPKAKSSGAQRESEGIVVLLIAATNNAAGGKGPCGGSVDRAATCEGMTGKTGSNHPAGRLPGDKVRYLRHRLGSWPSRGRAAGTMPRSERPLGKPCAGNPHARFERGSCLHPANSSNWRQ